MLPAKPMLYGFLLVLSAIAQAESCFASSIEDKVLAAWEARGKNVKRLDCEFIRWEYSPQFGGVDPNGNPISRAVSSGRMAHLAKGQWEFQVDQVKMRNLDTGRYETRHRGAEHWVFDGRDYWEIDAERKSIQQIPGDSAFLGIGMKAMFAPIWLAVAGGKAAAIRRDYDVRVVTAEAFAHAEVWVELKPRSASARAVYSHLVVMLNQPDLHPYAVRMTAANGSDDTVFEFRRVKINNVFAPDIRAPKPAEGWQMILASDAADTAPTTDPAAAPAPPIVPPREPRGQRCESRRRGIRALFRRR